MYVFDIVRKDWVRGLDLNQRPSGYEFDDWPFLVSPLISPEILHTIVIVDFYIIIDRI